MLQRTKTTLPLAEISIVLAYAPLGLVRALSAKFSKEGVLVDTGCITLSNNSEVGIVLSIKAGESHSTHRLQAKVIGHDANGAQLAFQECDQNTLKALQPYLTLH